MTADNQQFFTRCPHCRTMFRVSAVDMDGSQGWVKCGRCKKVFDSEKNKLDPSAFIKPTENLDQQEIDTQVTKSPLKQNHQGEIAQSPIKQDSKSKQSVDSTLKQNGNSVEESQISIVEPKENKKIGAKQPQAPLFKTTEKEPIAEKTLEKQVPKTEKPISTTNEKLQNKTQEFRLEDKVTLPPEKIVKPLQSKGPQKNDKQSEPTLAPIKKTNIMPQHSLNVKAEKKRKEEKSQWTKSILAQAQSWKKEKNRFQSRRSYTSFIFALGLFALLIWQVAIVNYTKLSNYGFLSAPLNLTCAIFSCNQKQPVSQHEFEILHANLRRNNTTPGVVTISANLINYSNSDKLLPKIRLDLTDSNEIIVASKIISLVDNPQYIEPTISQLSPGQDVKLEFDIDRPIRSAVGFEISIIN